MTDFTHFHGTHWNRVTDENDAEDACFFDLDGGYSDFDVVYVTNEVETAVYFSNWNANNADDIRVILAGNLNAENILEKECTALQRNPTVTIDDVEYDVGDREEFFDCLRRRYDGFSIKGNYNGTGDDIVLFDANFFNATHAKLMIDGEWTEWLDREDATALYMKICGLAPEEMQP